MQGIVLNEQKKPIVNGTICLSNINQFSAVIVKTDTSGRYFCNVLDSGTYDIRLNLEATTKYDYAYRIVEGIRIEENQTTIANLICGVNDKWIGHSIIICPEHTISMPIDLFEPSKYVFYPNQK